MRNQLTHTILYDYENNENIVISDEFTLQKEIVRYLRVNKPEILFTGNGFSDDLDTTEKRMSAVSQGYKAGCPDLLLFLKNKRFSGLAIELKTSTGLGKISAEQELFLNKLSDQGWFCLVTNSYSTFVETLTLYMNNLL